VNGGTQEGNEKPVVNNSDKSTPAKTEKRWWFGGITRNWKKKKSLSKEREGVGPPETPVAGGVLITAHWDEKNEDTDEKWSDTKPNSTKQEKKAVCTGGE